MAATILILLLWLAFGGSHIGLSSVRVRPLLIARLGDRGFQGLYSLISLALFIPLVWVYFGHKHAGPWLWVLPHSTGLRWLMYAGMGIAGVLLVASLARPSPAAIIPGDPTPKGVHRLARHPLFMAFALFGGLHLLFNSSTADIVFFGGFVVFTLVGARHQDQRKLATNASGYRAFYEGTPFLPFTGRETAQGLRELPPLIIAIGVGITILLRYFHASWFGG
jgi:uncharacterized membrane protein